MAEELVLYTNPMSRGRVARWMLEEIGAPYRTEILDYRPDDEGAGLSRDQSDGQSAGHSPQWQSRHRDAPRSAPISPTLSRKPGSRRRRRSRGIYYRWLFFAAGPLEAAVSNKALGFEVPPTRERMIGYGTYDAVLNALEGAVKGKHYIAGDRFTAADLYVGSHLGFGMQFGTDREAESVRGLLGTAHRTSRLQARC